MTKEETALYYTGKNVGHFSICLQMGPKTSQYDHARAFFDARARLGITGYMSYEEALTEIQGKVNG